MTVPEANLSETIAAAYTDRSPGDAAHQQDHDTIHKVVNALAGTGLDTQVTELVDDEASATRASLSATFVAQESTPVSVLDHGATGDGVTDDTAAIHAARDAAAAGRSLVFPAGTYLTAGLAASVAGQAWHLDSGATIKPTGVAPAITVTADRVTIAGGTIDGTGDTLQAGVFVGAGVSNVTVDGVRIIEGGNGVRVKDATGPTTSRVSVRNCRIVNPATHGVYLNWEAVDCEVVGNAIETTSASSNGVLAANGSTGLRVQDNTFGPIGESGVEIILGSDGALIQGNRISATGSFGVSIDKSDHCQVIGNSIEVTGSHGIELADSNRCVISNNLVVNAGSDAIRLNANSGFTTDHALVAGNQINTPAGSGIASAGVGTSAYASITANLIRDAGAVAIQPFVGCNSWIVSNNRIDWTVVSRSGLNMNGENHTVVGNLIRHDPAIAASAGTAIRIPGDHMLVQGNHVVGNDKVANGIEITAGHIYLSIIGNRVFGTTSNLILNSSTSTTNTLIGNHAHRTIGGSITPGGARGSHFDAVTGRTWHMGPQQFLASADIGFFGTAPISKRTGVAVDVAAIHAALVAYGLIS